jgi:hypothetical protein
MSAASKAFQQLERFRRAEWADEGYVVYLCVSPSRSLFVCVWRERERARGSERERERERTHIRKHAMHKYIQEVSVSGCYEREREEEREGGGQCVCVC